MAFFQWLHIITIFLAPLSSFERKGANVPFFLSDEKNGRRMGGRHLPLTLSMGLSQSGHIFGIVSGVLSLYLFSTTLKITICTILTSLRRRGVDGRVVENSWYVCVCVSAFVPYYRHR